MLDFDSDELYLTPCSRQGLQLILSEEEYMDATAKARIELNLGDSDDLLSAIHRKIKEVVGILKGEGGEVCVFLPLLYAEVP